MRTGIRFLRSFGMSLSAAVTAVILAASPAPAAFNRVHYYNSRGDGHAAMTIVNKDADKAPVFVPLRRTELSGSLSGPLASISVTHTFGFSKEQSGAVIQAVYRFPNPGDAAVTRVSVAFGDVRIEAVLKEREQAEKEHAQAVSEGRQSTLLTRESPDVFTLWVAGIHPGQDVRVTTEYVQLARTEGPGWTLRVPLTTAPRYVRSDELTSPHAKGQPLLTMRDPGHRFSLDLTVTGPGSIESPSHAISATPGENGAVVRLKDGEVIPDRDFVLRWTPLRNPDAPRLQIIRDPKETGETFFLATLTPPSPGAIATQQREVILLIDHSGSMEGAKWESSDWTVKRFLGGLTDRDRVAVGVFHNFTMWYSEKPLPATRENIAKITEFVLKSRLTGGTELGVALEQAVAIPREKGPFSRNIVIVTDAQVSDEGRLLRLAEGEFGHPERRRISVLCIDAAPNSFLATQLAERGGGVARFLTSSPEQEDITTAFSEVLEEWSAPVIPDAVLEIGRKNAIAAGRRVIQAGAGRTVLDLGDLPPERSIAIAGSYPAGDGTPFFRLSSPLLKDPIDAAVIDATPEQSRAIRALAGAGRVTGLEFLLTAGRSGESLFTALRNLGYDPDSLPLSGDAPKPKVYAENTRAEARKLLRGLLVAESLKYGVACSETAFVATRTEAGKKIKGTVPVANALPAGWSDAFLSPGAPLPAPAAMKMRKGAFEMLDGGFGAGAPQPSAAHESKAGEADPSAKTFQVFEGTPVFSGNEAVLVDFGTKLGGLPQTASLSGIAADYSGDPFADDVQLLLYLSDDPVTPRARIRLSELVSGGKRPLNLFYRKGQLLRIVLVDPSEKGVKGTLRITLSWR
jgi:Ca-activated chloride channel family protein